MGRPKGIPSAPPVILKRALTEKMAKRRLAALDRTEFLPSKIEPAEVDYFLSLLASFDRIIRPTVPEFTDIIKGKPSNWKNTNNRYTPLQMYEAILAYLQLAIENGRDITISHMAMFCGYRRDVFSDIVHHKGEIDKNYAFLKDCMSFVEGYMEYMGQKKQNPAFQIFWLKNQGWKDKFEIEAHSTQGALTESEREAAQKRIQQFSEVKP